MAPVVVRLYDLSHGTARQLAPALLGMDIEGIWHTGVFVFGREYFYGGGGSGSGTDSGISSAVGSGFSYSTGMRPVRELPMGETTKTKQVRAWAVCLSAIVEAVQLPAAVECDRSREIVQLPAAVAVAVG